jgi:hypothetical protein
MVHKQNTPLAYRAVVGSLKPISRLKQTTQHTDLWLGPITLPTPLDSPAVRAAQTRPDPHTTRQPPLLPPAEPPSFGSPHALGIRHEPFRFPFDLGW